MVNTRKGSHTANKVIHSPILLNADQGKFAEKPQTNADVCKVLKIGIRTINRVKQRFVLEGLDAALSVASTRRIYRKKIDGETVARLIPIACSELPKEYGKWSLRLLADRMIEFTNKPLTKEHKANNKEKSRTRVRVEHVFGSFVTYARGSKKHLG